MGDQLRGIWHNLRGIAADKLLMLALRIAPPDAEVNMAKGITWYLSLQEKQNETKP